MFDRQAVKHAFGQAAPVYDAQAQLQQRVRARCFTLAQTLWPDQARIIDAGGGTGALAQEAAQAGRHWHLIDLDIALGMCKEAKAAAVNADAACMPFADASMDGVFSSLMLQWTDTPAAMLREMARVIKPGRHVVLATFTHGTLGELRETYALLEEVPPVSNFLTVEELRNHATQAGLEVGVCEQEEMIEYHQDMTALLHSPKAYG